LFSTLLQLAALHRAFATTSTVTLGHGRATGGHRQGRKWLSMCMKDKEYFVPALGQTKCQHNTIFYAAWWCLLDKSTERQLLELITGLIGFYHCCKFWIIPYVYYVVVYGKSE
jgi:hypothetical protein